MSDDGGTDSYTEYLRKTAAWAQNAHSLQTELVELLRDMQSVPGAERFHRHVAESLNLPEGFTMEDMKAQSERLAERMEQVAAVQAAQALAHEAMIAAGGPDNSRAYVEYEAATKRNMSLLPTPP
jgi:hypothetical protein